MQLQTSRSWICVAFFLQFCCLSLFYLRLAFFHRLSFGHIYRKTLGFFPDPHFPLFWSSSPPSTVQPPASSSSTPGRNNLQHTFSRGSLSHTVSIIGCFGSGCKYASSPLFARCLPCRPKMLTVVARGYPHAVAYDRTTYIQYTRKALL